MNLKLSDMASIAEVIGAVAIVVSLIYVGVEVNDSTRAVRSATANETTTAMAAWYNNIGSNSEVAELFARGMGDPESFQAGEELQFYYLVHSIMLQLQAAYYLSEEGTLDTELSATLTNVLTGVRATPGFREYWGRRQSLFSRSFREYVDDVMENGTTNTAIESLFQSDGSVR